MRQPPLLGGCAIAAVVSVVLVPLTALAEEVQITVPSVNDLKPASNSALDLLAQQPTQAQVAQVTAVRLNPTPRGLEVILETTGSFDEVLTSSTDNSLITDIPNAQLRLPKGGAFRQDNPTQEIASVEVVDLDAKAIRVTVTGKAGVPTAEVSQSPQALILSVAAPPSAELRSKPAPAPQPAPAPTAPPATPAPESPPAAPEPKPQAEEERLEFEVRAEEEEGGYNVPDATTGTRTDTPLRDIPASIQVVPQQVLRDQQVVRLDEALRNVSSVIGSDNAEGSGFRFSIRGFEGTNVLRDGFNLSASDQLRESGIPIFSETASLERIEVLKGPASILYGEINPGGVINLVTKKPLSEPFYEAELQVGSRNFVRPRIDVSGPLTANGNLLYRLNAAYQRDDGFRDFDTDFERLLVAPVVTWQISDRTDLTVELEYLKDERPFDSGLPAFGNGVIDIPRDRITNHPDSFSEQEFLTLGYTLEHRFSENWQLRNAFRYVRQEDTASPLLLPLSFDETTGIVSRLNGISGAFRENYALQTNLVGEVTTGSVEHTLLFGVDLSRNTTEDFATGDLFSLFPLDIFDPVYENNLPNPSQDPIFGNSLETNRLGVYLQDQISLFENLKLLAGLRYDTIEQRLQSQPGFFDPVAVDRSQNPDAFTPRVGIVYQPVPELSLYASYSQSFTPNSGVSTVGEFLEPENGQGYEAGVKAELLQRRLFATLAYYNITKQNVASPDPINPFAAIATGEQRSRGVEFDLSGEILPGWNIIASYGYTDAEVTEDERTEIISNRLVGIPKNSASLWTTYEIQRGNFQGLGFGIGFNFVGDREGDLENSFQLGSYFLTNAAIFYRRDNYRFGLNFKNLFDVNYVQGAPFSRVRGIEPGEPFTVLGSVSVEF